VAEEKHDAHSSESAPSTEKLPTSSDITSETATMEEKPTNSAAATAAALKPLPLVDVACAFNFAVGYFHTRAKLIEVRVLPTISDP
jgi:hypothetical protein